MITGWWPGRFWTRVCKEPVVQTNEPMFAPSTEASRALNPKTTIFVLQDVFRFCSGVGFACALARVFQCATLLWIMLASRSEEGFSRWNSSSPPPPPRLGFRVSFDFWTKKKLQQHKFGLTKALHLPPGDGWIWFGLSRCQLLGSSHRRGLCNNCCHGNNFYFLLNCAPFFFACFCHGEFVSHSICNKESNVTCLSRHGDVCLRMSLPITLAGFMSCWKGTIWCHVCLHALVNY